MCERPCKKDTSALESMLRQQKFQKQFHILMGKNIYIYTERQEPPKRYGWTGQYKCYVVCIC